MLLQGGSRDSNAENSTTAVIESASVELTVWRTA
jgi:hypothetical protein